jgi:putative transposase
MKEFSRRPPRLDRIYRTENRPVWFVTFCTHKRQKWLASEPVHASFIQFAQRAARQHGVGVGRYIIMPDHLHLFVCGGPEFVLASWVGAVRQSLAKAAQRSKIDGQIWQEGFFDHMLRNDESMGQKWDYVHQNAVRACLVGQPDDWPYQGEIVAIDRT